VVCIAGKFLRKADSANIAPQWCDSRLPPRMQGFGWVWWCTPAIPAFGRLRQEDHKLETLFPASRKMQLFLLTTLASVPLRPSFTHPSSFFPDAFPLRTSFESALTFLMVPVQIPFIPLQHDCPLHLKVTGEKCTVLNTCSLVFSPGWP
jgi:hypothetical protein